MKELIDSILLEDYVSANRLFEQRLDIIAEKKLYEKKRSIDITEIVRPTGKLTVDGNPEYAGQNDKNDWARYRKQNKRIKWDQDKEGKKVTTDAKSTPLGHGGKLSRKDIEHRKKKGYMNAAPALNAYNFVKKVKKYKETGKLDENIIQKTIDMANDIENQKPAPGAFGTSRGKNTTSSTGKTKQGPYLDRVQAARQAATKQSRTDAITNQSFKNILGGKDIKKNVGRLLKYGMKSTVGKAVGAVGKSVADGATEFASNVGNQYFSEEAPQRIKRKRMILAKKKRILVTRKSDPHAMSGGGVREIPKYKYNPKIHNLAVEE